MQQFSTDEHNPGLAGTRYAGTWFQDLDLDEGLLGTLCGVADTTLLHDGSTVLDARSANERVFGCSAEALIGRSLYELLRNPDGRSVQPAPVEAAPSRARLAIRPDGRRVSVFVYEVPAWCHGRTVKLLAIREAKRCRPASLVEYQEPRWPDVTSADGACSSLSSSISPPVVLGIAHDLNGTLTSLLTGLDLMGRRGLDEAVHKCAVDACRRASALVAELVTVGMGVTPASPLTNLEEAVGRGVRLAAQDSEVQVRIDLDEGLWPVYVNEARFERVVYNLALNAIQAMPGGGALHVTAENAYVHQPSNSGPVAGRAVRVSVRDTGPGIPSAALPNIFEPYFSTKPKGMGIGLATCRDLAREAGGDITVESRVGVGTTFHVYLPAGVQSEPPPAP